MPTINLKRKSVESLLGRKLSPLDIEKIPMLGVSLEFINNEEIVIETFINRPDYLSEQGFTRALSSFLGIKTGLKKYEAKKSDYLVVVDPSVNGIRPITLCAVVKNLKLDDEKIKEIIKMQEKLDISYCRNRKKASIGIYPLEKIKFPVHYKALHPQQIIFQPLEINQKLNANEILEKHPTGRKYSHLLHQYSQYPVFIDSNNNIMSLIPIINSHLTGRVTTSTKEVFIECSGYDINTVNTLLNIITTSLADMNGEVYLVNIQYGAKKIITPDFKPKEFKINLGYVNKMLGLNLKETDLKKLLERMGFSYLNKKVLVPCYRTDILHQIDLVEDIAIAYGYENFTPSLSDFGSIAEENKFETFKNKIAEVLIGLNFIEVNTFHITNKINHNDRMNTNLPFIPLKNALTEDYNILRSWLVPSLVEVLSKNKHNEYPQKIFEISEIFEKDFKESTNLAILISSSSTTFTDIKQVLDALFNALDVKYEIKETSFPPFIEGRLGKILVKGKEIAGIGELSPQVIENWQLENPVSSLELNLNKLYNLLNL